MSAKKWQQYPLLGENSVVEYSLVVKYYRILIEKPTAVQYNIVICFWL